jgi:hypothetical protein
MPKQRNPLVWFFLSILVIFILALFGPEEQSLGANVKIVYLHGAWVLTAELAFAAAALTGLAALLLRRETPHQWSAALGRAGLLFWITYLPLSLWAMQSNWNGLFLAEPRFRLALTFAVVGLLLQAGLWILNSHWVTSLANVIFILVLRFVFATASNVMHPPPSPIFNSGNFLIMGFFVALNVLAWVAAFFLALWLLQLASRRQAASPSTP